MVDAIGWKTASAVSRVAPAAPAAPVVAPAPVAKAASNDTAAPATGATAMARTLSAAPPVDAERVAKIKAAIATGKFPILPSTIADRLLALKLDWNPNAKA